MLYYILHILIPDKTKLLADLFTLKNIDSDKKLINLILIFLLFFSICFPFISEMDNYYEIIMKGLKFKLNITFSRKTVLDSEFLFQNF